MRSLISHLRYTIRLLLKSPGFTITAVLVLGFGIGANTAIFSLINGVLLKPLPYPHSDQIVMVFQRFQGSDWYPLDYPDYIDFKSGQHTFQDLTAFYNDEFTLTGNGEAERVKGLCVGSAFFRIFGRPFLLGRPFPPNEDEPGAPAVVVLSENLWRSRFHGDTKIVGTNLTINGENFEVIGVTPAVAGEDMKVGLYLPLGHSQIVDQLRTDRAHHTFWCVGRLGQGVTLQQAQADLEVIRQNLATRYPGTNSGLGIKLATYRKSLVSDVSTTLWLLGAAIAGLLLLMCANVASLLLVRVQSRIKELAIRSALGAERGRLVLQLLTESAVLSLLGGVAGVPFSYWAIGVIKLLVPSDSERFNEIGIDGLALIAAFSITGLTALIAGFLPALAGSKTDPGSALKQDGGHMGTAGPRRQRAQSFLVSGQVALASILLIGAGLLARSLHAIQSVPLGFSTQNVLIADIYLSADKYAGPEKGKVYFDVLLETSRHLPGVNTAAMTTSLPFSDWSLNSFGVAGDLDADSEKAPVLEPQAVSPDYFSALQIPLLRGRAFNDQDQPGKEKVVIINESLAQHFFPGQDPIGKQIHDYKDRSGHTRNYYTIVGVVGNTQHDRPETPQTPFQAYYPYAQDLWVQRPLNFGAIILKTEMDPRSVITDFRKAVAAIDPDIPILRTTTFDDFIEKNFAFRELTTAIVGVFAGVAMLLATIGLYAVISYSVARRTREIGIRTALGASSTGVLVMVIRNGLAIASTGLVVGVVIASILSRFITSLLYGVSPSDPLTLGTGTIVLGMAAFLACLIPALRATWINPIKALRE
jgi:putative ABC transport system permease protein